MSYYMDHRGGEFYIDHANAQLALEALKKWGERIWPKDAWGEDPVARASNLADALVELFWEADMDKDSNITDITFNGEKIGEEAQWMNEIAPYVKKGSMIEMQGEDGSLWCWYFNGESCCEYQGCVIYPGIPNEMSEEGVNHG